MSLVINASEVMVYTSPSLDRRRFAVLSERDLTGSERLAAGIVVLPPGQAQPGPARHPTTEEVYFVLRGRGEIRIGEEVLEICEGSLAYIPCDTDHQLFNTQASEELRVFWANTPPLDGYKPVVEGWERSVGI